MRSDPEEIPLDSGPWYRVQGLDWSASDAVWLRTGGAGVKSFLAGALATRS